MLICGTAALAISAKTGSSRHASAAAAQYTPPDQQPGGQPSNDNGGPPANQQPRIEGQPGVGAYIADNGHALVKLHRKRRVKIPGLSFTCPKGCKVLIVIGHSRIRLTVPAGKTRSATFKVPKSLRTQVRRRGFVTLKARVTLTPVGGSVLHMKKSFVLAR